MLHPRRLESLLRPIQWIFFLVTDEVYLFFVKSAGMENPDELQYPDVDIRSNIYLKSGFSS